MEIVVMVNGKRQGPFDLDSLRQSIERGEISLSDRAWYQGCAEWSRILDMPELANALLPPLPHEPSVQAEQPKPVSQPPRIFPTNPTTSTYQSVPNTSGIKEKRRYTYGDIVVLTVLSTFAMGVAGIVACIVANWMGIGVGVAVFLLLMIGFGLAVKHAKPPSAPTTSSSSANQAMDPRQYGKWHVVGGAMMILVAAPLMLLTLLSVFGWGP